MARMERNEPHNASGIRVDKAKITRFRAAVYRHFSRFGRDLPWRRDYGPYAIFVSEVMLQQTQVDRVAPKFERFIRELPDFSSLAVAPLDRVLRLWQGLGYNRRALHCKNAARAVIDLFGGTLPDTQESLATLPGIGKATAASIAAFAFNKPTVFLETNIRTALIHHFFNGATSISDEDLLPWAEAALDKKNPRAWYSALMDYGTMLKKQHGNAARKSAGYKKQSRFIGSRRQIRGKIIALLLDKGPATLGTIRKAVGPAETASILDELRRECIIIKKKGTRFAIAP